VIVYGQTELTRDLYDGRDRSAQGDPRRRGREAARRRDRAAYLTFRHGDEIVPRRLRLRDRLRRLPRGLAQVDPRDRIQEFERVYPFGWLGVLSRTEPVSRS